MAISFVMSILPCIFSYSTVAPTGRISVKFEIRNFYENCTWIQIWLKSNKNMGHSAWSFIITASDINFLWSVSVHLSVLFCTINIDMYCHSKQKMHFCLPVSKMVAWKHYSVTPYLRVHRLNVTKFFTANRIYLNGNSNKTLRSQYTGCNRRNGPDFGRVFLKSYYTDITQNTYIQSSIVTEIMAREVWNFDSYYSLIDYQTHIETDRNMWFL